MEIWIKNQNGTRLIKANNILMYKFDTGEYGIQVNEECFVGEYATKERASEILDEIFEMLKGTDIINLMNKTKGNINNVFPIMTYEMPKE